MEASFWHQKWQNNDIGFHQADYNTQLLAYFHQLKLGQGARVLVPLCGKSRDLGYLLETGYHVVGIELSELAVVQLFEQLGLTPTVDKQPAGDRYHCQQLEVWVADIFALTPALLGHIDGVYDRAALIALPPELRGRYATQLLNLSAAAPQLLLTVDYEQSLLAGPPFAVPLNQVNHYYDEHYKIVQLPPEPIEGGLKGKVEACNHAYLLQRATA
ncbi:thiopurine S-methyltransferase [uncultured Ferrimonas sp.]|uniref:thiopurine S-methyltransferase n=1 Tax=uncultured Ferrimonas sp. TaxID=432640 RepID=UPI002638B622|nr:thiopurine S-methyltransferase [uncultured Ferrimonas sp.]